MVDVIGGMRGAVRGFREGAFNEGSSVVGGLEGTNQERWDLYRRNWDYYRNTAFEDLSLWAGYMYERGLYEETRLIYNPLKRLVEFYVGRIYPGRITADGQDLPYAVRNAVPFSDKVTKQLAGAAAQVMEWSQWQVKKSPWIRLTAVMGLTLLEIVDDVVAGKVRLKIWPATMVKDFRVNAADYLEEFWLEYPARMEPDGEVVTYGRRVTRTEVIEYENAEEVRRTPINYGFVPAVITRHKDLGDDYGADVFDGDYIKLEELNSVATHGLDNLHKNIDPAIMLWTDARITDALKTANATVSMSSDTESGWKYEKARDFKVLKGGTGGKMEPMVGRLASDEVLKQVESLVQQIEKDHPELVFYDKLREMQYVSGPGARSLIGDTESNYMEACANYDAALERALEMAIAIGGKRLSQRSGAWSQNSEKQQRMAGFDLESFAADKLNVEIMTRPLLPWTVDDETAVKKGKAEVAVIVGDFVSKRRQMMEFGIEKTSEQDEILKQIADEDAEIAATMSQANSAGDSQASPQAIDPNATANTTQTGKVPQESQKK